MPDPRQRTILLVEDEALIAQAERMTLTGYGYSVLIASSGDQALTCMRTTPGIDLVLMDIDLGRGIDGPETAARILKERDLPIVFLSSHSEPAIVEKVERITSYGYVLKESSPVVLNASIRMAFRLFEANREVREKERLLLLMAQNYPNSTVSLIERDLTVGFASGQALKAGKRAPADVIGMSPEHVYGDQAGIVRAYYERTFAGEECSFDVLTEGRHSSCRTVPLYDDHGVISRILAVAEDVTERKRAEEHIRLSHETYKGMINSVTEAIYVQDENGVFLDINDRCVDFYGIAREDVIGRTPEFLSAPGMNDLSQLPAIHARAFAGEPQTIEFWGRAADGTVFPKEVTLSPGMYFGQKAVLAVARNVTVRKKREQELRETTQLLRDVTENMFDTVVLTDMTGNFTYVSGSIARLGYQPADLIGRNVLDLVHPDELQMTRDGLLGMIRDGHARQLEFRYRCADGTFRWFEVMGTVLPGDGGGIPARCIFSGREVTERRVTDERLRESEAYLKAILGNSYGSIWAIDRDYKILYVNDVFARDYFRVFGIELRVGESIVEKLPPALVPVWKERYERVLRNERFTFEDMIDLGEQRIFIDVAMNPIVVDGQVVGASMHGGDVTEQKLTAARIVHEKRLRELLIELSSRFIDQPLSDPGTAIRTSLAKLGGFVGADRAYVFSFDRAARTGSNTFEWCREGITPQIDNLQQVPFDQVESLLRVLDRGETIHIPVTSALPPGGHKDLLEAQDIKSMLNIPLMRGGACIGFVGFDSVVRHHDYSLDEQQLLHVYAGMLVNVLERQEAEKSLHESKDRYHSLFSLIRLMSDTMPDMLWAKDLQNRYIFANKSVCRNLLNARDTSEPLGKTDMFFARRERESHPDDPTWHTFGELCVDSDAVTLQEMKEMQFDEYGNVKGTFLYLDVHKAPLLNDEGELIGVVGSARDITARKQAEQKIAKQLAENELLLKEVHHRIRNNITSIASLLTMQSRSVTNPEAIAILQDAIARVGSMKVLYEKLLHSTDHEAAPVKPFIEGLISSAAALFPEQQRVRVVTEIENFEMRSKKLFPFGIIITELLTNAFKYAFVGRGAGEIMIRVARRDDQVTLTMTDDGIGLPAYVDPEASTGFGLLLIKVLSEQLEGTCAIESKGGTRTVLTFGC